MRVEQFMGNLNGTLHGGAIATILDLSTTVAIMSLDHKNRANVSAELGMSFMSSAPVGEDIWILSQVDRVGKKVAFSQAWVYNKDRELLVAGRHLKSFLDHSYHFDGVNVTYPKK